MTLPTYLEQKKDGAILLRLWVQPGAKRSGWAGVHGERLKVKVAAPAAENRANRELIRFLAKALGIPAGRVELVSGQTSRGKTVRLQDVPAADVLARIPDAT